MKKGSIIFTITIIMLLVSAAGAAAQDLYFGGYARNTTGVMINDNLDFSQVQNTFDLSAEYYGDMSELKAEVFLNQTGNNELEAGVKELYMDIFFDSMDIRIGKQQIIWGKADGVFITDVISPKDLSDFVLPDFDEIRMGVTALKADYYMDAVDFELVWVPMFTPAVFPSGIWAVPMTLPNGSPIVPTITSPSNTLENSEIFGKMSFMGSLIDIEFMGGYMWDDLPSVTSPDNSDFYGDYHRVAMAGGSFSTDIAGFILRGEGAYYNGRNFSVQAAPITTVEKDFINYMIGLDYSIGGFTLVTQFIQEIVLDYDDRIMLNDEFKNTMTFVIAKPFLNDTLMVEFFSYIGLTNEDALLRPKVTYDLADGFEWVLGADIFLGDSGDFGQYDANDLVYTKVKYSF